ncbi:MAG: hypothetical protein KJN75_04770 [Muriicola sp.]|nr:hypothetical protein [Muriicola sp.]NNL01105.1 hypothetical protein [Eudoraea sp.]
MKTNSIFLASLFLLFFGTVTAAYAQTTIVRTITLVVNKAEVTRSNPSAACYFEVSKGTTLLPNPSGSSKDFGFEALVNDSIVWEGKTTDGDYVKIKKIKYNKKVNNKTKIFKSDDLRGRLYNGREKVKGKIIKSTENLPDFIYDITFKIKGRGRSYTIDPKIKVGGQ